MIEIEFEPPSIKPCDCCQNDVVRLTRFVNRDGDAHAVYYCLFTRGHEEKVVSGIVSLGKWWEGSTPEDRVAFPFRIWTKDQKYQVGLVDRSESPWSHVEELGTILDRKEGLEHVWLKEVFHITDHIVTEDQLVINYLK